MTTTAVFPRGARRALLEGTLRHWSIRHRRLGTMLALALVVATALIVSGRPERAQVLLAAIAFFGPFVVGLVTMTGVVTDDIRSGIIVLWYQQPGALAGWYTRRYVQALVLLVAFALVLGAVVAALGIAAHLLTVERALRTAGVIIALTLLPAAMVFAYSAWGVLRDGTVALLTALGSLPLGVGVVFDDSVLATVVRWVIFPIDAIQVLSGAYTGPSDPWQALAIVVGQFVGWTAVGLVGLRYLPRKVGGA